MAKVTEELKRLKDIANSNYVGEHQASPPVAAIPPQVARTVDQLYAVRKHTLVRYDRKAQFIRQQGSGQQVTRQNPDYNDIMDLINGADS